MTDRYHSALIWLHWLIAALVIGAFILGQFVMHDMPNTPEKLPVIQLHLLLGATGGLLMIVRIFVRFFTKKPPPAPGNIIVTWVRRIVHFAFYIVVLSMVSTGLGTAQMAGLFEHLQGKAPMPETFDVPAKIGHENFGKVLLILIVLHVLAALWHHFVRKDGLLARMGLGTPSRPEVGVR